MSGCAGDTRRYRAFHQAEALWLAGWEVGVRLVERGGLGDLKPRLGDVVVCHRVEWSTAVAGLLDRAHAVGCPVLYDCDDLIFEPEAVAGLPHLAPLPDQPPRPATEVATGCRRTLEACDGAIVPTAYLASRVRSLGKPVAVVPNALSLEQLRLARQAARRRASPDRLMVGYVSGTPTHDRDFAVAQAALQRLMGQDGRIWLRLHGYLTLDDSWRGLLDRVERVPFMSWRQLMAAMAELDVNLAPLVVGDPFCESKSELKYFEAGIVGVPTVASATEAYREAIEAGRTGLLAETGDGWYAALQRLLQDPAERREMGQQARVDAVARYLTDGRATSLATAIRCLGGDGRTDAATEEVLDVAQRRERAYWLMGWPAEVSGLAADDRLAARTVLMGLPTADGSRRMLLREAMQLAKERIPGVEFKVVELPRPSGVASLAAVAEALRPAGGTPPAAVLLAPESDDLVTVALAQACGAAVVIAKSWSNERSLVVPGSTAAVAPPLADWLVAELLVVLVDASYRERLAEGSRLAAECWARLAGASGGAAETGLWCLDQLQPLCGPRPIPLGGHRSLAQSFTARLDGLARFEVRFGAAPVAEDGQVSLEIRRGHVDGDLVRRAAVRFTDIVTDEWTAFAFPPIVDSAGQRLVARLDCPELPDEQGPEVWLADEDVYAGGRTYLDGRVVGGALTFRTFCQLQLTAREAERAAGRPTREASDPWAGAPASPAIVAALAAACLSAARARRAEVEALLSRVENDPLHGIFDHLCHRLARAE